MGRKIAALTAVRLPEVLRFKFLAPALSDR